MNEYTPSVAGYTALPQDLLSVPMSDGAFRTLVLLCAHASAETGECYPSQAQLAALMGKSKASVSAHVKELRGLGLVNTRNQTARHGGNYRLRYLVTFWRDWRARLKARGTAQPVQPVQSVERPVRQAERLEKKNHNQVNHSPAPSCSDAAPDPRPAPMAAKVVGDLIEAWQRAKGRAPFPGFDATPPADLVEQTRRVIAETAPQTAAPPPAPQIREALAALWRQRRVEIDSDLLDRQVATLARQADPARALDGLRRHLARSWPDHWRRMSTPAQFDRMLAALPPAPPDVAVKLRMLASDLRRHAAWRAA